MQGTKLEISWASLWRVLFFVVLVAVLYSGRQILLGLFLAIIISSGLETTVDFLEKIGVPRTLGVILIFLVAILLIIILIYTVIPLIIVDLNAIFSGYGASGGIWEALVSLRTSSSLGAMVSKLSEEFFAGNISPMALFSRTLGSFGLALAVLVSSFYLSLSRDGVERFIRAVFPVDYVKRALNIYERSRRKIGFWFQAQILMSFIMGVLVWAAMAILGIKHAFLLGILAGIFEIVPFVGPIISGAIAVLAALSVSATLAVYTLLIFLALQQFESHVLVPLMMKKKVGLHPIIVIISLLIGAEVGGFLGAIIAVPAAAVFEEALDEWSGGKRPAMEVAV